jgi:hypothetical protein
MDAHMKSPDVLSQSAAKRRGFCILSVVMVIACFYSIVVHSLRVVSQCAQLEVRVNNPPKGGNCTVAPRQGDAVSTLFIVGCGGWGDVEAHYPLAYSFNAYRSW